MIRKCAVCVRRRSQATDDDWGKEYLDLIVAVKVVADLDEAVEHIQIYGSNHTDVIVSENEQSQDSFFRQVGSSCVVG